MGLNIISPPGTGGGAPSGGAGGVLSGTYPNPGFAVNMATQAELDAAIVGLLDFKGSTDGSANPNYPAAAKGDCYVISVAGKIGGASGKVVSVGDLILALADNAGGSEASVGTNWDVLESNIPGITVAGLALLQAANVAAQQAAMKIHTHGADIASASTINLETATGNVVDITGTTTITAVTLSEGQQRFVRFTGALTLTHGASLVLPTTANITTVAGDYALFIGYATGVVRVLYFRASGAALAGGGTISDPDVAYIRSDGNDATGVIGNPALPYLTGQAAYDDGAKHFDIGVDCLCAIITTANEELFVRGRGYTSEISIETRGKDITIWDVAGISTRMYVETTPLSTIISGNGGSVVIHYGYVTYVSTIAMDGDSASPGGTYKGYNAGNVTLFGPMAFSGQITANGGDGGTDNDAIWGDGGDGGVVDIRFGVKFLAGAGPIEAKKGLKHPSGSSDGADGTIALRGCDTGAVTPDCGVNTPTYCGAIVNGVFYANGIDGSAVSAVTKGIVTAV